MGLVAEVLLQRTRADQVVPVFLRLKERFPTAAALSAAPIEIVEQELGSLGLRWRAPLLHQTASLIGRRGGIPPDSLQELRELPGIGPYAAAAWLSLHRGTRAVIVDNNIARWLCRLTGSPYDAEVRRKRWLLTLADQLTPTRAFRDYNYAVLDFTRAICTPRSPKCGICPLRDLCHYNNSQL